MHLAARALWYTRGRRARARRAALALFATLLALSCALAGSLARAESPTPGGTVPSTLGLSLSEPSPFRRVGRTREGRNVYVATVRARVTATDVPTRLGLGLPATPLRLWREPLAAAQAKIRLRRVAPDRRALGDGVALVTLTAGGP